MKVANLEARRRIYNILHDDYFSWTPDSVEALQMAMDALKDFPTQMSGTSEEPKQPDSGFTSCGNPENTNVRTISDRDAHFGELVLWAIQDVERPILRYEPEKEAVKHALEMMLEAWKEEKRRPSEHQWIPCSERLPESDGWYMTTYDGDICGEDGKVFSGMSEYENGQWVEDTVYAWMPLPEPYKENKT